MALPTDGYSAEGITYTFSTSNGLAVTISAVTDSPSRRNAAVEFLPYLDAALEGLRTDYQNGTSQTVLFIDRAYSGSVHDSL